MSLKSPSYFFKMVFLVLKYKGNLRIKANFKQACAKAVIDSLVLYIPIPQPPSLG
jgi:hypothetical protein